jgi:hypothetical protein
MPDPLEQKHDNGEAIAIENGIASIEPSDSEFSTSHQENKRSPTVAWIAITLIIIFGVTLLGCFCVFTVAIFNSQISQESVKDLAIVLLNPATTLATFAVGFYLGSKSKEK